MRTFLHIAPSLKKGLRPTAPWLVVNVGVIALVAGGALFLSSHWPRTWISGHVYGCGISTKATWSGCKPIANLRLRFASPHGSPYFVATTDSKGGYSIDVPPGQYVVGYEAREPGTSSYVVRGWGPDAWGGSPLTIGANEHVVRDLRFFAFAE